MRKFVIAGGPCCGKTTLINEFEKQGFSVLKEFSREILEQRKDFFPNHGEKLIRQHMMFEEQLKREMGCEDEGGNEDSKDRILFLDRSIVEIIPYSKLLLGYVPKKIAEHDFSAMGYDTVFILERLPFVDDGLRIESGEQEAEKIHGMVHEAYLIYGYKIIKVPVMAIEGRIEFIKGFI